MNIRGAYATFLVLLGVQLILGASLAFVILITTYMMMAVISFNLAGGFNTFSGAFIGFNALQSIIIAMFAKTVMLQASDSNLLEPTKLALLYVICQFAFLLAVIVTRKIHTKPPLVDGSKQLGQLYGMSIAGTLLGVTSTLILGLTTQIDTNGALAKPNAFYSYLVQMPLFSSLGIILGTSYILRTTNNKKAMTWYVAFPIIFDTVIHFIQNTKSGTYQPLITWLVVCAAHRYRFNRVQIAWLLAAVGVGALFVFPFIQVTRGDVREGDLRRQTTLVYEALQEYGLTGAYKAYKIRAELQDESNFREQQLYYGKDMGALDRISLIEQDDALIHASETLPVRGLGPFKDVAIGFIPRILFPDKDLYIGEPLPNEMGHAIGQIAPDDDVTKIAFSHFGPAYYMVSWWAPFLVFICAVPMFAVVDRVYGDVRTNVFCLIPVAACIHMAAESNPASFIGNIISLVLQAGLPLLFIRIISPLVQALLVRRHTMFGDQPRFRTAQPRPVPALQSEP